ncbi:dTMP kinase [Arthrobacter ginsengisoli]|uniref:Thymidylate kinase n=1 Tax=Arthrobacter ginsengisoli TaxID=1356565 RepID=A0ABU1UC41_9MICC|nr:dTMP kinase [Arthrobacter ginsengisoli]MDR7082741.1 dTMP kinase [Arthrobacter ginsengisoli]
MLIVLTGIDGSGKTTAAQAMIDAARHAGNKVLLLRNHAGRRRMSLLGAKFGVHLPPRLADLIETAVRTFNVLNAHRRARRFQGLVVMDRHLHCQLALRQVRGLPRGRWLPFLIRTLPQPDLVIHLDVDPCEAYARVVARGTDSEQLEDLESLHEAYRLLPEFPRFTSIPAGGPPADVLSRLHAAMTVASHGPAGVFSPTDPARVDPAPVSRAN